MTRVLPSSSEAARLASSLGSDELNALWPSRLCGVSGRWRSPGLRPRSSSGPMAIPLPRPPAWTCALTTIRPPPSLSNASAAASGDSTTIPSGTATPAALSRSFAWYSWTFMGRGALPGRALETLRGLRGAGVDGMVLPYPIRAFQTPAMPAEPGRARRQRRRNSSSTSRAIRASSSSVGK